MTYRLFDDDYDPLAPPATPEVTMDDELPAEDPLAAPDYGEAAEELAPAPGDGGHSDEDRIVRIWLSDGRLTRVRLSPVWFQRVTGRDTLARHFRQAFMLAALEVAQPAEDVPAEPDNPLEGLDPEVRRELQKLPSLNRATLAAFAEASAELDARIAAAHSSVPRAAAAATGRSKGVTLTLDDAGLPAEVTFEPKWLEAAHVGSICSNVLRASAHARERHVTQHADADLADLFAEREMLRRAYRVMLLPHRNFG